MADIYWDKIESLSKDILKGMATHIDIPEINTAKEMQVYLKEVANLSISYAAAYYTRLSECKKELGVNNDKANS